MVPAFMEHRDPVRIMRPRKRHMARAFCAALLCFGCGAAEPTSEEPTQAPPRTATPTGDVPEGRDGASPAPNPADAAEQPTNASGSYGPGSADPFVVRIEAHGEYAVPEEESCPGWFPRQPTYVLHLTGRMNMIRVFARSEKRTDDLVLAVTTPSSARRCSDDFDGYHPLVKIPEPGPGVYRVWVGSFEKDQRTRALLGVSSDPSTWPSELKAPPG